MFRYSLFLKGKFIHFSFHHLFESYQKIWFFTDFGVKNGNNFSRPNNFSSILVLEMRLFLDTFKHCDECFLEKDGWF